MQKCRKYENIVHVVVVVCYHPRLYFHRSYSSLRLFSSSLSYVYRLVCSLLHAYGYMYCFLFVVPRAEADITLANHHSKASQCCTRPSGQRAYTTRKTNRNNKIATTTTRKGHAKQAQNGWKINDMYMFSSTCTFIKIPIFNARVLLNSYKIKKKKKILCELQEDDAIPRYILLFFTFLCEFCCMLI